MVVYKKVVKYVPVRSRKPRKGAWKVRVKSKKIGVKFHNKRKYGYKYYKG